MTEIIFTEQYANVFFLINGLAILFYLAAKKQNRQRAIKFGNYETLQKVSGRDFLKSSNVILLIRILALTSLIIGISSPVLVNQVPSSESDYVIAIDSSSSMLASDLKPTRFEAAKKISSDFVTKLSDETKIGIISFSGEVKNELRPSQSKKNVSSTIKNIEIGNRAGTAIGDALSASTSMLIGNNKSRSIVLITDGRNNVGSSVNESIKFAKRQNVTVNSIGIGSQRNDTDNYDLIQGQNASKADFPNLDQQSLFKMANETGGQSITVTDTTQLRKALIEVKSVKREEDISQHFIFLAVFFLMLEWILGTTRYSVIP